MYKLQRFVVAFWNSLEVFYNLKRYLLVAVLTYAVGIWGFIKIRQLPDDSTLIDTIVNYGSFIFHNTSNFFLMLFISLFAIAVFITHGLATIYCSIRLTHEYEIRNALIIIMRIYGVLACLWSLAYSTLPVLILFFMIIVLFIGFLFVALR